MVSAPGVGSSTAMADRSDDFTIPVIFFIEGVLYIKDIFSHSA